MWTHPRTFSNQAICRPMCRSALWGWQHCWRCRQDGWLLLPSCKVVGSRSLPTCTVWESALYNDALCHVKAYMYITGWWTNDTAWALPVVCLAVFPIQQFSAEAKYCLPLTCSSRPAIKPCDSAYISRTLHCPPSYAGLIESCCEWCAVPCNSIL